MPINDYKQSQIQERLVRSLAMLRTQLVERMEQEGTLTQEAAAWYQQAVTETVRTARELSQLGGWLSPWFPDLYEDESLQGDKPLQAPDIYTGEFYHSLDAELPIRFEQLQEAKNFLNKQISGFPLSWAGLVTREQLAAETQGLQVSASLMAKLNRELEESISKGESRETWRARVSKVIALPDHSYERIARTATHRSFHQGKAAVLGQPGIGRLFPYRQYRATMDNRVRPSHAELNKLVYHRNSELAGIAASALSAWSCRCSEIPLTRSQAVALGIDDDDPGQIEEDRVEQAFAAQASADQQSLASQGQKRADIAQDAQRLADRIGMIDPHKLADEANQTKPVTVEAVERLSDGRSAVRTSGGGIVELEGDAPEPGEVVSFDVVSSDDNRREAQARRFVRKVVSLAVLGRDAQGRYRLLSSGSALPTARLQDGEEPIDAARRLARDLGIWPKTLAASQKFTNPSRNPLASNEWAYGFVATVSEATGESGGLSWVPISDALAADWSGDFGTQVFSAIRSFVKLAS